MQTATKERLTGAALLVIAMVILVPELFSGRRQPRSASEVLPAEPVGQGPPVRTLSVETDPGAMDADESLPLGLPQDVTAPADGTPQPASSLPAPQVAGDLAPPAPVAAVPPVAAAPAERPRSDAEIAREERARAATQASQAPPPAPAARAAGRPTTPSAPSPSPLPSASSGPGWYVQAGSFASEANARRLQQQLKSRGHASVVVRGSGKAPWRVRVGPVKDAAAARDLRTRLAAQGWAGTVVPP